jgi:hypothetical protein
MRLPDIWAEWQLFDFSGIDGPTDFNHPTTGSSLGDRPGFTFHLPQGDNQIWVAVQVGDEWVDAVPMRGHRAVCSDLVDLTGQAGDGTRVRVAFIYWHRAAFLGRVEVVAADGPLAAVRAYVLNLTDQETLVERDGSRVILAPKQDISLSSPFDTMEGQRQLRPDALRRAIVWSGDLAGAGTAASYDAFKAGLLTRLAAGERATGLLAFAELSPQEMTRERWRSTFECRFHFEGEDEPGQAPGWESAYQGNVSYYASLPTPPTCDEDIRHTFLKACSALKVNTYGPQGQIPFRWTTPDRWPHRHMWLWDSAFQAFGYKHIAGDLGEEAIQSMLALQRDDGYVPLCGNNGGLPTWLERDGEWITQPPTLAWAAWDVYQTTGNRDFLRYCLPRLTRFMEWLLVNRDVNGNGLLEWLVIDHPICPCGESGMDNSSRFQGRERVDSVDLCAFVINEIRHLEMMAAELGQELADLSARADHMAELVNERMWDEETGFYYDLRLDGSQQKIKTVVGFYPLLARIASPQQARRLLEHLTDPGEFWSPLPVRTEAADEPTFDRNMWRGPVWMNCNWVVICGLREYGYDELANEIGRRTIREIVKWYHEDGSIYELYHDMGRSPQELPGKEGYTGYIAAPYRDYGWSCAVFIALAMDPRVVESQTDDSV